MANRDAGWAVQIPTAGVPFSSDLQFDRDPIDVAQFGGLATLQRDIPDAALNCLRLNGVAAEQHDHQHRRG